jgi:hypothetical protein
MAPPAPLTARHLGRATLARQGLLEPMTVPANEAVARLGSLQAQHPEWPPVALASRAATPATADLAGALDRREVVRSSLMRITIHVVAATHLWPMFTVMRPLRLAQWRLLLKVARWDSLLLSHAPRHRQRVIADGHRASVFSKNADVLPTLLVDGVVAGTWTLSRATEHATITLHPFRALPATDGDRLAAEAERLLTLLAPDAERTVELASGRS